MTDIVEKEMYTFDDRNGDNLTLRPEGYGGLRAAMEHGLLHNQTQRLWYQGPMFRHEQPQKGRYRQFQQIGVETFGIPGPDIDAELIPPSLHVSGRRWYPRASCSSIPSARRRSGLPPREELVWYFDSPCRSALDDDSRRRRSNLCVSSTARTGDARDALTRRLC